MDLVKLIHESITRYPQEKRLYIGASGIGGPCARAIWYGYKGYAKEYPAQLLLTFEVGKYLEKMLINELGSYEGRVIKTCEPYTGEPLLVKSKECPQLQGHMDGIINDEIVLEIKTAKNASFTVFKRDGLKRWSPNYFYQLQAYMGMAGLLKGVLLAINKDTSELHEEWMDFEPETYRNIVRKAQSIVDCNEAPGRINNNPGFYICSRCEFKKVCHG